MATRKKAVSAPAADDTPVAEYADFIDTESLSPALEAIKAELGIEGDVDCSIHVSLLDADGEGNEAKVWQGNETDYNLEAIARKFGSGRYRIMGYVKRPDGSRPRAFNRVQGWMLSPEDQAKVNRAREAAKNPPPEQNAQPGASDTRGLIREMMLGMQETLAAAMKPQANPLEQMQQLAAVMKTLMPATTAAPVADPFTQLAGLLGIMEKLKGVTGGNVPDGASASETLLLEAARTVLPALASGLQKQTQHAPPVQTEQPAQEERKALPAPSAEQALTEEDEMEIMKRARLAMFQVQLNAANRAAARGAIAVEYAETIYDVFDDSDIENFALDPNWFALLCEALPACKAHEAWYAQVRDKIVAMAIEDGILQRDAAGALTLAGESGTTGQSSPEKDGHGPAATGSGGAAGSV